MDSITIEEFGELMMRGMIVWEHPLRSPAVTQIGYQALKNPTNNLTEVEWGMKLNELLDT